MITIHELKEQRQEKTNQLLKDCHVFFAFNNQQFEEGSAKYPLQEGDKYVRIFGGGIMPKSKVEAFTQGLKDIEKWYKAEVKAQKGLRRDNIIYELSNHEAWYTHDIEDTLRALGSGYTAKEVWKVFNQEIEKQIV